MTYSLGPADVFASIDVRLGPRAHNGQSYNAGVTWYFDLGKTPFTLDREHGVTFNRRLE